MVVKNDSDHMMIYDAHWKLVAAVDDDGDETVDEWFVAVAAYIPCGNHDQRHHCQKMTFSSSKLSRKQNEYAFNVNKS